MTGGREPILRFESRITPAGKILTDPARRASRASMRRTSSRRRGVAQHSPGSPEAHPGYEPTTPHPQARTPQRGRTTQPGFARVPRRAHPAGVGRPSLRPPASRDPTGSDAASGWRPPSGSGRGGEGRDRGEARVGPVCARGDPGLRSNGLRQTGISRPDPGYCHPSGQAFRGRRCLLRRQPLRLHGGKCLTFRRPKTESGHDSTISFAGQLPDPPTRSLSRLGPSFDPRLRLRAGPPPRPQGREQFQKIHKRSASSDLSMKLRSVAWSPPMTGTRPLPRLPVRLRLRRHSRSRRTPSPVNSTSWSGIR